LFDIFGTLGAFFYTPTIEFILSVLRFISAGSLNSCIVSLFFVAGWLACSFLSSIYGLRIWRYSIKKRIIVLLIVVPALAVLAYTCSHFTYSQARWALPATATDVREIRFPGGLTGVGSLLIKAKMPKADFDAYREKRGFVTVPEELKSHIDWHGETNWGGNDDINSWWDPSKNINGTYCHPKSSELSYIVMKYENGYLYYLFLATT